MRLRPPTIPVLWPASPWGHGDLEMETLPTAPSPSPVAAELTCLVLFTVLLLWLLLPGRGLFFFA